MKYYISMRSLFVTNGVLLNLVIKDGLVIGTIESSGKQVMIPLTSINFIQEIKA